MPTYTSRLQRGILATGGLVAAATLLAACGGSAYGSSGNSGSSAKKTTAVASSGKTVTTGKTSAGTALVDANGMTLYAFGADSPGKSNCTGGCAGNWPPAAVSGSMSQSSDVTAKLGTIKRSDGTTQLTVNGSPAYTYAGDSGPGQASGQGLNVYGGVWSVISPSGP